MKQKSLETSLDIAKQLNINLKVVPLKTWKIAMKIELEHGKVYTKTNVTDDDLLKTGKIALAHLLEDIYYYQRLEKMEKEAKKFWKGKKMPNPVLPDAFSKKN
jgi:hypothetical protein